MKILYLSFAELPSRTANSIHVMKMCSAFAAQGHQVCLVAPGMQGEARVEQIFSHYGITPDFTIKKIPYPLYRGKDIINLALVAGKILTFKPDLVYGRHLPYCFLGARLGVPTVFEAHGPVDLYHATGRYYFNFLVNSPWLRKIVVISDALKQIFQKRFKIPKHLLLVAHDGADVPLPGTYSPWPGIPGHLQVGYSGHLYRGRGIEIIVELARRFEKIDFHIAGGTDADISSWQQKTGLANLFFHGFILPQKIDAWRNRCDILLAPYQEKLQIADQGGDTSSYMSPLKIFEYMASRKPIICSDLPVIHEVLNPSNAVLVPATDIDKWAKALTLLHDTRTRNQIAATAFDDLLNHYTWSKRAQKILARIPVH